LALFRDYCPKLSRMLRVPSSSATSLPVRCTGSRMHDVAKDFEAAFIVANLDPLRALPILRVPGSGREPGVDSGSAVSEER